MLRLGPTVLATSLDPSGVLYSLIFSGSSPCDDFGASSFGNESGTAGPKTILDGVLSAINAGNDSGNNSDAGSNISVIGVFWCSFWVQQFWQ